MSEAKITSEMLNAYVDGELSRSEAAGVARAAARSPVLASHIATLREMKAAITDIAPERAIALPGMRLGRGRAIGFAAAAAIAFCLFAGLIHAFGPGGPSSETVASLLQSRHDAWSFDQVGNAQSPVAAGLARKGWPPDLSSARLSFAGFEAMTLSGTDVLWLGYEGTRGCKLSLYVLEATLLPQTGAFSSSLHVRSWTIGERGFVLMADGMPRQRFDGIAAAMENSLRAGQPFDAPTRQRLARARRVSPPCHA